LTGNQAWFDTTGHPNADYKDIDWNSVVHEDDIVLLERMSNEIIQTRGSVTISFRLKKMWKGAHGEALSPVWILATANPEIREDGTITK
jgi:hypothetical protein